MDSAARDSTPRSNPTPFYTTALAMASANSTTTSIPVIDVSSSTDEVATQLLAAASTHGFVFVSNYREILPPEDVRTVFELVLFMFITKLLTRLTSQVSVFFQVSA